MRSLRDDIAAVLISEEEIDRATTEIAAKIDVDYSAPGTKLVLVCILKGSLVFMGDLMKKITVPVEIDCMKVSSYGAGTESSGQIHIALDLIRPDISECDILIIEDIIDSGITLSHLTKYLTLKGARSVRTCTMLDKPSRRRVEFKPDYCGFEIPDEFVVGYGLDYAELYRALPFVGVLKPEVYSK